MKPRKRSLARFHVGVAPTPQPRFGGGRGGGGPTSMATGILRQSCCACVLHSGWPEVKAKRGSSVLPRPSAAPDETCFLGTTVTRHRYSASVSGNSDSPRCTATPAYTFELPSCRSVSSSLASRFPPISLVGSLSCERPRVDRLWLVEVGGVGIQRVGGVCTGTNVLRRFDGLPGVPRDKRLRGIVCRVAEDHHCRKRVRQLRVDLVVCTRHEVTGTPFFRPRGCVGGTRCEDVDVASCVQHDREQRVELHRVLGDVLDHIEHRRFGRLTTADEVDCRVATEHGGDDFDKFDKARPHTSECVRHLATRSFASSGEICSSRCRNSAISGSSCAAMSSISLTSGSASISRTMSTSVRGRNSIESMAGAGKKAGSSKRGRLSSTTSTRGSLRRFIRTARPVIRTEHACQQRTTPRAGCGWRGSRRKPHAPVEGIRDTVRSASRTGTLPTGGLS
eukprot:417616-Prymnesium_polylepis.2